MTRARRIRLGMVGGGEGAFIGAVHRIAARIDDEYSLVAGALSSNAERAHRSAAELHIAQDRSYTDFRQMAITEANRPDGIDAVAIVTPNHLHYPIASAFLAAGIHVICDKPLTSTLADAHVLVREVRDSSCLFALTHNYSGYPMVRQAKAMVGAGELGQIRVIQAEYAQEWLTVDLETNPANAGQKQAAWRVDPLRAGSGGALGDIGTHAEHLARFISGLELVEVSADLSSFVGGRALDDNAHVLLRYSGGAKGMLWASQVAPGNENGLKIRIYGTKGGLEFGQENPNQLWFTPFGQNPKLMTRGGASTVLEASHATRLPSGHPEGYLEGFAQLYADFAEQIHARWEKRAANPLAMAIPTVHDGLLGLLFIEAVVASNKAGGQWTRLNAPA
jgi:predicted dehydrogenase